VLHGILDHKKVLDAVSEADVLINIGNKTTYQLPSKLVDYMATGKPVLNLASIRDDSSADVLRDYPNSLTIVDDNFTKTSSDFSKLINFFENLPKPLDRQSVDCIVQPYKKEVIARKYMQLLKKHDVADKRL
jgi:hypothetical protein